MYLHLYHGRKDSNQDMDDWGTDGSQFKITSFVCTYMSHVRVTTEKEIYPFDLLFKEDLVFYDGVYYGDFAIYDKPLEGIEIKELKKQ